MLPAALRFGGISAVILAVVMASASLALAFMRGAFDIARGDDWSYLNMVLTGTWGLEPSLNGWVHMMFVSQELFGSLVVWLAGGTVASLHISALVLGVLGLVSTYAIARQLVATGPALMVVLVTGLSPLWLHLSATFMTDIPAWSLSAASLALGIAAVRRQRTTLLIAGSVVSLLAFGIREYASVPFAALLAWVILQDLQKRFRLGSLILGVMLLFICSVTYLWRQSLPGSVDTVALAPYESVVLFSRLLLTLALLLAPYLALGAVLMWPYAGRVLRALRNYWPGASVGTLVGVGIVILSSLQLAGNVIHPYGSSWTSVGDGVRSLPLLGFRAVTVVGAFCLFAPLALSGMLVQKRVGTGSWRFLGQPQVSGSFAGLYLFISLAVMAVYFVAIFFAGAPAFDRYLLFVVPLLGIVILWLATCLLKEHILKWQKSAVAGILVVTGAFGVVITDGLNQVDGLRWQVASEMVASGIPAYKIDGGDAWFRYHQRDVPGVAQVGSLENSIPGRTWWQTFFEGSTFCRMVAIESETDLQAMYGPALSILEERTLLGTQFRVMVFPGPDSC